MVLEGKRDAASEGRGSMAVDVMRWGGCWLITDSQAFVWVHGGDWPATYGRRSIFSGPPDPAEFENSSFSGQSPSIVAREDPLHARQVTRSTKLAREDVWRKLPTPYSPVTHLS